MRNKYFHGLAVAWLRCGARHGLVFSAEPCAEVNDLRTMHLFAGAGGGLLADLILGHTPVVAVELDAYACQILRERAADGWFPGLHVWEGDVRLFDPSEYAGRVDCIHAGFPCQDISLAGKQAGVGTETRSGLYREVLRIAGVVRPRQLFLENVSAIVTNGLGTVLADLAALGYDSEWLCLRASDCGANHQRDRWWLLADSERERTAIGTTGGSRRTLCHGNGNSAQAERERDEFKPWAGWHVEDVAHTSRVRLQRLSEPSECEQPINRINSRSSSTGTDNTCGPGAGWWEIEPSLGRVADGISNRVHQLKGLGNAQVPLQAAVAWRLLGGQ